MAFPSRKFQIGFSVKLVGSDRVGVVVGYSLSSEDVVRYLVRFDPDHSSEFFAESDLILATVFL